MFERVPSRVSHERRLNRRVASICLTWGPEVTFSNTLELLWNISGPFWIPLGDFVWYVIAYVLHMFCI